MISWMPFTSDAHSMSTDSRSNSSVPMLNLFARCPPFPDETLVAIAPVLHLHQLQTGGAQVSRTLYQACREYGYFMLDLRNSVKGIELLQAAESMFEMNTETFDLGGDVLKAFTADFPRDSQGYKAAGQFKVDNGKVDTIEGYTVFQDDVTGVSTGKPKPTPIEARQVDCNRFVCKAHEVLRIILSLLDQELDLPVGTLASLSPIDKPSSTSFRILRNPPNSTSVSNNDQTQVALAGHTDIGVITMVFNVVGGLQVLPAGCENTDKHWKYIKPKPGCVVVQVGDALVEWTGGLLRSNLHRVVSPPGEQARVVRQSVAYLLRPADDASMQRLKGGSIIPNLETGEKDETRTPAEWAVWRINQIMLGLQKPATRGGAPVIPMKTLTT